MIQGKQGEIGFAATLDTKDLERGAKRASKQFQQISKAAKKESDAIKAALKEVYKAVGIAFSAQQAVAFVRQIVNVRSEIQALEVSFSTLLGSQQASTELMQQMKEFAAATPLQIGDLAKAAQTMLGFNLAAEEVMPMLKAIGDISMGDAQKFQSLTLAFSQMSSVGKLMGQDLIQMINAGFSPLAVMSETTGKSIKRLKEEMSHGAISADMVKQAFIDATSEGGKFYGMLASQGDTVKGAIAQLSGAITDMLNGIGERSEGIIKGSVKSLQWLAQNYEKIGKILAWLIVTYGVYKAAIIAQLTIERVAIMQTKGFTAAQVIFHSVIKKSTHAMAVFNKTMMANKITLVAMAVIGLIYGVYKLATAENAAERAQRKHNEAMEEGKKQIEAYNKAVEDNLAILKDDTATQLQRTEAYEKLIKLMPQLKGMSMAEIIAMSDDKLSKLKSENADTIKLQQLKKDVEKAEKDLEAAKRAVEVVLSGSINNAGYAVSAQLVTDKQDEAEKRLALAKEELKAQEELQKRAEWEAKPHAEKVAYLKEQIALQEQQQNYYAGLLPPQAQQLAMQGKIEDALKACEKAAGGMDINIANAVFTTARLGNEVLNLKGQLTSVVASAPKSYKQALKEAKAAYDQAKVDLAKIAKSGTQDEWLAQKEVLDKAEEAYKALGGDTSGKAEKDAKTKMAEARKNAKQLADTKAEFRKQQYRQEADNALALRQAEYNALEDGLDKELKLAQLQTDRLKEENRRRKEDAIDNLRKQREEEWRLQNPEKAKQGFEYTGIVTEADLPKKQQEQFAAFERNAIEQGTKAAADALKKRTREFESYQQERLRITEEYRKKEADLRNEDGSLKKGVTQDNIDELKRQSDEALAKVDETWAQREETYKAWMNDIASMSLAQLEKELTRLQGLLATAKAEGKDGIQMAVLRTQVEQLTKQLKEAQKEAHSTERSFADWAKLTDTLRSTKDELSGIAESVRPISPSIADAVQGVAGLATPVIGIIGSIGKFAEMTEKGVSTTATATQKAISAAQKGVIILTILSAALQIITKIIAFYNKDKAHDKRIKEFDGKIADIQHRLSHMGWEELEASAGRPLDTVIEKLEQARTKAAALAIAVGDTNKALELIKDTASGAEEVGATLADAYMKADYMADKAFGSDRYSRARKELELMGQQLALIAKQREEEEGKKKKDNDKIEEYTNKMKELSVKMAQVVDNIINGLLGGDAFQLADKLGNALFDAFSKGEDAAKAFGNTVDEVIRNMVKKLLIQKFLEDPIRQAIAKYKEAVTKDGKLDLEEMLANVGILKEALSGIGEVAGTLPKILEDTLNQLGIEVDDALGGQRKGIAAASQDSIDELNGRATAIQTHTAEIAAGTARLVSLAQKTFDELAEVSRMVKEGNAIRLRMESATANLERKMRDFETQGIKLRKF